MGVRLGEARPQLCWARPAPGIFTSSPGSVTYLLFYPGGLREGKKTGQESAFRPCESCLGVMIEPALEGAGQPARRRGMASERRVAATGPTSGCVWGKPLPGEAMGAT